MTTTVEWLGAPGLCRWFPPVFRDNRGTFRETYSARFMAQNGLPTDFVQDNCSVSHPVGVLRGLHCQRPPTAQSKLVRVARGSILDVVVDARVGSPAFGQWFGIEMSAENNCHLFVPRGFLHGFVTLEPMTEVQYKVDSPYSPADEITVVWSDPDLAIDWRLAGDPTVSDKDAAGLRWRDFASPFKYDQGKA